MTNTRLMERLFSATEENDAELTAQVAQDIEAAHEGPVETEELVFEDAGDGRVAITDKENGEVTIAEKAGDGNYDLSPWMEPTAQPEKFIHPEGDGVTPGNQVGAPDEHEEEHMAGAGMSSIPEHEIAEEEAEDGVCPKCGQEECECSEDDDEDGEEGREFSVATDNYVVQRIFSDQEYMERLFSEVIESEESAKVGDLKIDKIEGEDAVIVTSESTGDQARVDLTDEELEVTELDSKQFAEESEEGIDDEEQYEPLHVVGIDSFNHELIDAPEYDEESAQELVERLEEQGVDAVQIFEDEDEARDYALDLLDNLGAEDAEEPEAREFSEHLIYVTRYYSNNTCLMDRMFSEACNDVEVSQAKIEDALESGEQIETDDEVVTPIDAVSAVVEDKENGEFTKVTIDDDSMDCEAISEEEAEDLTDHLAVEDTDEDEDEDDAEEREYSYIYDDDEDYRYFSEYDEDEDEAYFSDIYSNDEETKFFSENEYMTDYMVRLFSEEADEAEIEDAIESGEQIENDSEVITPIDAVTAVIEDKENGEFTKAVMDDEKLDLEPISEDEADELTEHLAVEDTDEDEDEDDAEEENEEEKKFSTLDKFFAQAGIVPAPAAAPVAAAPVAAPVDPAMAAAPVDPNAVPVDENGNPIPVEPVPAVPTVEAIEDKAVAAVQSIQAAAAEAQAQILNAKAAPVEQAEADLQEAQFSYYEDEDDAEERSFSETEDTLVTWLDNAIQ